MLRALHQAVAQRNEEATRDVVTDLAEKVPYLTLPYLTLPCLTLPDLN